MLPAANNQLIIVIMARLEIKATLYLTTIKMTGGHLKSVTFISHLLIGSTSEDLIVTSNIISTKIIIQGTLIINDVNFSVLFFKSPLNLALFRRWSKEQN